MKILITGASGYLGGYILREAAERRHEILIMQHKTEVLQDCAAPCGIDRLCFELGGDEKLNLKERGLDAIIHLAASLSTDKEKSQRTIIEGTRQLAMAATQAKIDRLVCLGSMAAIDYSASPAMSVIDETSKILDYREGEFSYARLKAGQEAVISSSFANEKRRTVILRPGLVYDANHISTAHAGIVRGPLRLLASHKGQVPLVGAAGLAKAVLDAMELKGWGTEIIHLLDDRLPTQAEYIERLYVKKKLTGRKLAIPWQLFALGATLCRGMFKLTGMEKRLPELLTKQGFAARLKPFQFSNEKVKTILQRSLTGEF